MADGYMAERIYNGVLSIVGSTLGRCVELLSWTLTYAIIECRSANALVHHPKRQPLRDGAPPKHSVL